MITQKIIEHLQSLRSDEGIVSVYLTIPSHLRNAGDLLPAIYKGLCKTYSAHVQEAHRDGTLQRENPRILEFLEEWNPHGRGLAIFACQPIALWEIIELDVPAPALLDVDATPKVSELLNILDKYPRFVLVVAHRKLATIYVSEQNQVENKSEIRDDVHRQHAKGGSSQHNFKRHIEFQLHQHLKNVVTELQSMCFTHPYSQVVIAGPDDVTSELLEMLPESIANRVSGMLPIDEKQESRQAILDKAAMVCYQHEYENEKALVDGVVNSAHAGGQAVIGHVATLPKLYEGRVHQLVVAEGAKIQGAACSQCGYFSLTPFKSCPICKSTIPAETDIIEQAMDRAFLTGAEVRMVHGEARDWLISEGCMGATLRY